MLHMNGVADPIAWAAKPDPIAGTGTLEIQVIIRILMISLDQVVVHILNRNLGTGAAQAHRLQLQHNEGPGGILRKTLVDADPDHFPGCHLPFQEMALEELV